MEEKRLDTFLHNLILLTGVTTQGKLPSHSSWSPAQLYGRERTSNPRLKRVFISLVFHPLNWPSVLKPLFFSVHVKWICHSAMRSLYAISGVNRTHCSPYWLQCVLMLMIMLMLILMLTPMLARMLTFNSSWKGKKLRSISNIKFVLSADKLISRSAGSVHWHCARGDSLLYVTWAWSSESRRALSHCSCYSGTTWMWHQTSSFRRRGKHVTLVRREHSRLLSSVPPGSLVRLEHFLFFSSLLFFSSRFILMCVFL